MSGNTRELPPDELIVDASPRSIGESGSSKFLVGRLLEELPSDVCFVLVGREEPVEGFESGDP